MSDGSSESTATSSTASTIFFSCTSSQADGSVGDDSDFFGSTAGEDKEAKDRDDARNTPSASNLETSVGGSNSGEDEEGKDRDDARNTPYASNLGPWRSVSRQGSFKRTIKCWRKVRKLGDGSCGAVYEAITDDGYPLAVKEVFLSDKEGKGNQRLLELEQEIKFLREFEHENIVQYIGTDKDNENLYVFLELMTKGSLSSLYSDSSLSESQVSTYTWQILNGLKYLHERKVIHRDIKCANILVGASGSVKLADFGLAKATEMNAAKSFKGTLFWMAPEVLNRVKSRSYGLEADIWSLGCTVVEMLRGGMPYSDLDMGEALEKIRKGEPPRVPKSLSEDARDFVGKCLQRNTKKRPSAVELLYHPFVMKPSTSSFA